MQNSKRAMFKLFSMQHSRLPVEFFLGWPANVSLYALRTIPDAWLATPVQLGDRLVKP
jgi:hypothetical protein